MLAALQNSLSSVERAQRVAQQQHDRLSQEPISAEARRQSQLHAERLLHARGPISQVLIISLAVSHCIQSLSYVVLCAGKESGLQLQATAITSVAHQGDMPDVAGDLPSQADEIDVSSPTTQGTISEPQSATKQPAAQVGHHRQCAITAFPGARRYH